MKAGRSIQEMAREILRQSAAKQDYAVNTANMHMEASGPAPVLRLVDNTGVDRMEPLDIQQTAHRQLSAYMGIPQKYYEKMLTDNVGQLADNVNSWLSRNSETRLIRTMDGKLGIGCPGGLYASCGYNVFGSGPNNKGKACSATRS